jgi:hypothetical protein
VENVNKIVANLIAIILIASALLFSGCVEEETPSTIAPSPKLTTKEPSELVLQLSDFPSNYTLKERTERLKSDVIEEGLDLGWKKGYYVRYARIGDSLFDITVIEQYTSVYPIENISKFFVTPRESTENTIWEEFSKPNIGDDSKAYRVTVKDEFGTEDRYYIIQFIKLDVYEAFYMSGTTTDYELLKDLAKKAESKIE